MYSILNVLTYYAIPTQDQIYHEFFFISLMLISFKIARGIKRATIKNAKMGTRQMVPTI